MAGSPYGRTAPSIGSEPYQSAAQPHHPRLQVEGGGVEFHGQNLPGEESTEACTIRLPPPTLGG